MVAADSSSSIIQYLVSQTDFVMKVIHFISTLDINILSNESQMKTMKLLLALLIFMANSTSTAMSFLQMNIIPAINNSILMSNIKEDQHAMIVNQLSEEQKNSLRSLLSLFLQLLIVLDKSVQSIRNIHIELISFVVTLLPLLSFIFKCDFRNYTPESQLQLELLSYFIGLLVIVANSPQRFIQAMNGQENTLNSEIISLFSTISEESLCNPIKRHIINKEKELSPYTIIIENSMVFMSKMNWKIGDIYLKAFGVK